MDELLEILSDMHPEVDFETCDSLIDDGILDSFDIVSLISEISENFDVVISAENIIPENFLSCQQSHQYDDFHFLKRYAQNRALH